MVRFAGGGPNEIRQVAVIVIITTSLDNPSTSFHYLAVSPLEAFTISFLTSQPFCLQPLPLAPLLFASLV